MPGSLLTSLRRLACAALAAVVLATTGAAAAALPGVAGLADLPQRWRDDDGRELVLAALAGERVILTMAYATCHRVCPLTIDALARMQRRLDERGEHAQIVVVGYDPANDDPAAWRQYRRSRHLDRPNWHFLTGDEASTNALAHALGFDYWRYDEHVMHELRALVFDPRGRPEAALGPETPDWASAL
ncbi:MAG: SCO family protein [Proteobacteria bacterium]|nr:SCO family protein [Pseudomonadota bacterium]